MSRSSLWDRRKNDDYYFIDEEIREMFELGGVGVLVHKYLGVKKADGSDPSITDIQDNFFGENRDRAYSDQVYEVYGSYNVFDSEFSIQQFGMILETDTLYLEFHINETLEKLGRKYVPGDVLEFPHLRDDMLLDESKPAINKFYVVREITRAANGWSAIWRPHIFRVKLSPMTNSSEFEDILDKPITDGDGNDLDDTIGDIIGDLDNLLDMDQAIYEEAVSYVKYRNFETQQFYVIPGDELGSQYPWIFAGDSNPPNGAEKLGTGPSFPANPTHGTWWLNTSTDPEILYQYVTGTVKTPGGSLMPVPGGGVWQRMEYDFRKKWEAAHRILQSFINNDNISIINGEEFQQKVALSKAVTIRADF